MIKGKPRRLENVFACYGDPLYFVTFATRDRRAILARPEIKKAVDEFGAVSLRAGNALGRYVIMPDHLHLFVRIGRESRLSDFVRLLKQRLSCKLQELNAPGPIWQPGFFDHLLRQAESYGQKWNYVRENPVRKQLVASADEWPYQGECVVIRW